MRRINTTLLLSFFLLLQYSSYGQSWQWGVRGGGGMNEVQVGSFWEQATDMATDPGGNVYVLFNARFDYNDVTLGTVPLTGYGNDQVVIASYRCDGSYRWSKVIGSSNVNQAVALKTDTLGGVYVACNVYNWLTTVHYGTDTVISASNAKQISLIKYDTAGNYKWLRRPDPDTAGLWSILNARPPESMDVEPGGNIHLLCYLAPGIFQGSFSVTTPGYYVLRYDRNGAFLGGTKLDFTQNPNNAYIQWIRLRRNTYNGKYIISGDGNNFQPDPCYFGATALTGHTVLASFNNNGTLDWLKQNRRTNDGFVYTPVVDNQGNVYVAGRTLGPDTVAGVSMLRAGDAIAFAMKFNASGSLLWSKVAYQGSAYVTACTLNSNGELVVGGIYGTNFRWEPGADWLDRPVNYLSDPYLTRLNAATGAYIKSDTIGSGPGAYEEVTAMTADRKGNIYLGGGFASTLKVGPSNLAATSGGFRDMFVAKYGYNNCNCTIPTPAFTVTNTGPKTVQLVYTGATAGLDSLVWSFGNGARQKVTASLSSPISYTYATAGQYSICVTAYNGCGPAQSCKLQPVSVESVSLLSQVRVYPNPVTDMLNIEGAAGATMTLSNLMGQPVMSRKLERAQESLSLGNLAAGMYLLRLQDSEGAQHTIRILKP